MCLRDVKVSRAAWRGILCLNIITQVKMDNKMSHFLKRTISKLRKQTVFVLELRNIMIITQVEMSRQYIISIPKVDDL
jgi:hypothetical protein